LDAELPRTIRFRDVGSVSLKLFSGWVIRSPAVVCVIVRHESQQSVLHVTDTRAEKRHNRIQPGVSPVTQRHFPGPPASAVFARWGDGWALVVFAVLSQFERRTLWSDGLVSAWSDGLVRAWKLWLRGRLRTYSHKACRILR
jgi:hypothetical protein